MKNRPARRPIHNRRPLEGLESRSLPSLGLAGVVDFRELGPVSPSAAASGVEATASIGSGDSVTFRFEIEAAGQYTLLVRHTGDGLTLDAKTPAGSAAIDPGPAGPFQVVPLNLKAATYEVKASAQGGRPVFVDWELLLNTGIGQSAATAPGPVLPVFAVQPPAPTLAPATPTGANVAHFDASFSLFPSSSSPTQALTWSIPSGPLGHPTLEPSALPEIALTTPGAMGASSAEPISPLDMALIEALQPQSANQVALTESTWWDRLFGSIPTEPMAEPIEAARRSEPASTVRLADGPEESPSAPAENWVSLSAISPGLLLGAVAVAVASRARIKANRESFRRKPTPRSFDPSRLDLYHQALGR